MIKIIESEEYIKDVDIVFNSIIDLRDKLSDVDSLTIKSSLMGAAQHIRNIKTELKKQEGVR